MSHPTFESAGAGQGTEIWTIENFEPVPVDTKTYGKFYNGDSYIVLKTTGDSNSTLRYDAHFWLGSKASQDKLGAAALWTVTLDDTLGGRAVHHREVQGHESSLFLGYFKPAIRYMEGGNESGFTEVETNAGAEKRLLKLSGSDNMRIEEVAAEASSLTADHCFILEVEHDIFVLMPDGAKATQRRKIISVANSLRDDYHNGRATIEIIDEFSAHDDYVMFFEALGSGSKDDLTSDDSSETYSRDDISAVYLYRAVLGDSLEVVALSKPYQQNQLSSDEVYILDTPDSGVYVWLGSGVSIDVKKNYHDVADQYLGVKAYPNWVNVTRVTENAESNTFKQYFHDWDTAASTSGRALVTESGKTGMDAGYFSGDTEESAAVAKLIGKSAAARGYMPDTGDGNLTVIRVAGGQEDITESMQSGVPVLYQSEAYVIKYWFDNGDVNIHVLYMWVGADASSDDKAEASKLLFQTQLDLEAEKERVTLVRIPQGKENKHFLSIFKGELVIAYGNKENDYKAENSNGTYDDDSIRLFRVEGTERGVDTRAAQVPELAAALRADTAFVLETDSAVYVWNGNEASAEELEAALAFVERVVGSERDVLTVEQGDEPDEFWAALGGMPEEKKSSSGWKLAVNRRVTTPHTLTAVTVKVTGKIKFEDLDEKYTQQDLSEDGVYILDSGEELYIWQGNLIPERMKAAREDIVKEYIKDDGLDRTVESVLVVTLMQSCEPDVFKKLFPTWDDDMWNNLESYESIKNEAKAANSK